MLLHLRQLCAGVACQLVGAALVMRCGSDHAAALLSIFACVDEMWRACARKSATVGAVVSVTAPVLGVARGSHGDRYCLAWYI